MIVSFAIGLLIQQSLIFSHYLLEKSKKRSRLGTSIIALALFLYSSILPNEFPIYHVLTTMPSAMYALSLFRYESNHRESPSSFKKYFKDFHTFTLRNDINNSFSLKSKIFSKDLYNILLEMALKFIAMKYLIHPFIDFDQLKLENTFRIMLFKDWHLLLNIYLAIFNLYLALDIAMTMNFFLSHILFGSKLNRYFLDPFLSNSPRDFWGRRWNIYVQIHLYETVFKPLKVYLRSTNISSKNSLLVSTMATFFVSGLIHEYWLYVYSCPVTGEQFLFFTLNGIIVIAENIVENQFHKLPNFLRIFLTTSILLIISPLFFRPYAYCEKMLSVLG